MIVRATYELRLAVFKVPSPDSELTSLPGSFPAKTEDLSHLLPIMPDWLKTMLINGSLLIVDQQEFYDLPSEISQHMEVITR